MQYNPLKPPRIRDFIKDKDDWIYAVCSYDNKERVGCILRYIPDESGERVSPEGVRYHKLSFDEAFSLIRSEKPDYFDLVHRVPYSDIIDLLKPDELFPKMAISDPRLTILQNLLSVKTGNIGCSGSRLCGLEDINSDIDLVVYSEQFSEARESLRKAVKNHYLPELSDSLWRQIYEKREPDINFSDFVLHEKRKWNRGAIDGTYFDILYSRSYNSLYHELFYKGENLGQIKIEADVTDDSSVFDSPAIYKVNHEEISKVLSFTHTYTGQGFIGETIIAKGVCENFKGENYLIVGTTRNAHGEYILSKSLINHETSK